jgi:bifunctional DNA-binding transcriptional regulator/antitoxin component of YhaV-PrlF toxin-antitoxin module
MLNSFNEGDAVILIYRKDNSNYYFEKLKKFDENCENPPKYKKHKKRRKHSMRKKVLNKNSEDFGYTYTK